MHNTGNNYIIVKSIKEGLSKARSGWIKRDISKEIAETVLQHINKVVKAASIIGMRRKDLEFIKLVNIARYHDTAEYKAPDYTPGEVSNNQKYHEEKNVMMELKELCSNDKGNKIFDYRSEYELQESEESKIIYQLDKFDAVVQALNYEQEGYNGMNEFYDYTGPKLTDPILINIFNILMKQEFRDIDFYEQYFFLLNNDGNEIIFQDFMNKKRNFLIK